MTSRRGFFGTLIAGIAALFAWPKLSWAAKPAGFRDGFRDREPLLHLAGIKSRAFVASVMCTIADGKHRWQEYRSIDDVVDRVRPPVIYVGDINDPNYIKAGLRSKHHNPAKKNTRCFVNGVDRTMEAYEGYAGDNGWCNLIQRREVSPGKFETVRLTAGIATYSIFGKVEFRTVDE